MSESFWSTSTGTVWIPDEASNLLLRLHIIAYTGAADHCGVDPTEQVLRKEYWWSTLSSDVNTFVRAFIHCISTTGRGRGPSPFGPTFHGSKPSELLQFDYVHFGPGHDGDRYVLLLPDDLSNYCWLFSTAGTKAENAANGFIEWCAAPDSSSIFLSDRPTHFRSETLRLYPKHFMSITTSHSHIPPGVTTPWNVWGEKSFALLVQ